MFNFPGKPIRIGRLFGFQLEMSWLFLALPILVAVFLGLPGFPIFAALVVSILFHEFGHAFVARRLKFQVVGIELTLFGGMAKIADFRPTPNAEILISLAGPAVSLLLGLFGLGVWYIFGGYLLLLISLLNLILLGAINLVPAVPIDGGRVFRALLAKRLGYLQATQAAVFVSQVIAVGIALVALIFQMFFLLLLSFILWVSADAELKLINRCFGGQSE